MPFEVDVQGPLRAGVTSLLAELVGPAAVTTHEGSVRLAVVDQAALVTVVARVHDLGLSIEAVRTPGGMGTDEHHADESSAHAG